MLIKVIQVVPRSIGKRVPKRYTQISSKRRHSMRGQVIGLRYSMVMPKISLVRRRALHAIRSTAVFRRMLYARVAKSVRDSMLPGALSYLMAAFIFQGYSTKVLPSCRRKIFPGYQFI